MTQGNGVKAVKIDSDLHKELAEEAKKRLRTTRIHLEDILKKHFKRKGAK